MELQLLATMRTFFYHVILPPVLTSWNLALQWRVFCNNVFKSRNWKLLLFNESPLWVSLLSTIFPLALRHSAVALCSICSALLMNGLRFGGRLIYLIRDSVGALLGFTWRRIGVLNILIRIVCGNIGHVYCLWSTVSSCGFEALEVPSPWSSPSRCESMGNAPGLYQ